jgi:Leucine-rich repeat (LRR) protein
MATVININPEDGPSAVTKIDCGTSSPKLSGTIDVSAFENLEDLTCDGNDISEITGFYDNPNIKIVLAATNNLTGPIPDLTSMTSLERYWVMNNEHTGSFPNINGLSELGLINVGNNNLTGTLPADLQSLGVPNLFRYNVYANSFTGAISDCTGMTKLQFVLADGNDLTDFTGGVEPSLYRFMANGNNLTETAVDNILQAFVDANRTTNMGSAVINLGGSGNAPPSAAGIASRSTLIGRGWSVTTN